MNDCAVRAPFLSESAGGIVNRDLFVDKNGVCLARFLWPERASVSAVGSCLLESVGHLVLF